MKPFVSGVYWMAAFVVASIVTYWLPIGPVEHHDAPGSAAEVIGFLIALCCLLAGIAFWAYGFVSMVAKDLDAK